MTGQARFSGSRDGLHVAKYPLVTLRDRLSVLERGGVGSGVYLAHELLEHPSLEFIRGIGRIAYPERGAADVDTVSAGFVLGDGRRDAALLADTGNPARVKLRLTTTLRHG